jgi:hypothetical protein
VDSKQKLRVDQPNAPRLASSKSGKPVEMVCVCRC